MRSLRRPFRQERRASSGRGLRPITVLTYNIQGYGALVSRRYLDGIARVIEEVQPDVVGLQEVHRGTWPARFEDQVEELARRTGLEPWFGTTVSLGTGDHGNAVLTRGRILGSEVTVLPGRMERRSLLACHLELEDGPRLDFFVTHLAAWGRFARVARSQQASFILDRLARSEHPYVLVGDFNAPPEAPELGAVFAHDGVRLCSPRGQSTHRFLRQKIDYICTCPAWHAVESRVLRTGPSDHFPVTARVRLRAEPDVEPETVDVSAALPSAG